MLTGLGTSAWLRVKWFFWIVIFKRLTAGWAFFSIICFPLVIQWSHSKRFHKQKRRKYGRNKSCLVWTFISEWPIPWDVQELLVEGEQALPNMKHKGTEILCLSNSSSALFASWMYKYINVHRIYLVSLWCVLVSIQKNWTKSDALSGKKA